MLSVSLWKGSMSWATTLMHHACTGLCPMEVAVNAKPALRDSGMSPSMGKADPEGVLKPAGHRNLLSSCLECWITKTMIWSDYSIQTLSIEIVY